MTTRRSFLKSAAAASTMLMTRPGWAQETAGKTLRFVPQANLTILDPIFTTAAVTATHGYLVFDTLYGIDNKFEPQPQMAQEASVSKDGLVWTITLRDGLTWHDGTPVTAADCAASLERWSQRDTFGQSLGAVTDSFGSTNEKTIEIKLSKAFPHLLEAIGKPHSSPAFMMPERLAKTSATEAVQEMVGSGPYRFVTDEYVSGNRVVYAKFEDYNPRSEPAEWTAGGKVAHFDRIEWHVIPDPATAVSALQNGEVDWVEVVLPDLLPVVSALPEIDVERQDPNGFTAFMRFNSSVPPFNNPELRRAVMMAVDQTPYMHAITGGDDTAWSHSLNCFPASFPGVVEDGFGMMPGDLDAARAAVEKSGYDGTPVVILHPTDMSNLSPHGLITADVLTKIGLNVDLQAMDWGTVTQRRQSRETVENGGWSIFHTFWPSVSIANPATNTNIRGTGEEGWFGWYDDPELESLISEWLSATDPEEAATLFEKVQEMALVGAPCVPLGQYFVTSGFSSKLNGILPGSASFFWNVETA